jgi:hypothetical protein
MENHYLEYPSEASNTLRGCNMLVVNHRKMKTMTANATTTLITSPMNVFGGEGMGVQLIVPGVYRKTSVGVWS